DPSNTSGRFWTGDAVRWGRLQWPPAMRGKSLRRFGGRRSRRLHAAPREDRFDLRRGKTQLAEDVGSVLADVGRVLLRRMLAGGRQARDVGDRQAAHALQLDPVDRARLLLVRMLEIVGVVVHALADYLIRLSVPDTFI